MSSTVLSAYPSMSQSAGAPGVNHWVVAVTVTLATFMEVLDTSVANVSLPYIAGDLGVSQDEASWVLTTYLVANAVVLPLSGWVSGLIGRKRFYMTCVALFTISSALCGLAPSLGWLLFFRVLQGAGGGGLQPSEQGILLDTFPGASAAWPWPSTASPFSSPRSSAPLSAVISLKTISWRWIFYINVPVGVLSLFLTSMVVHDPAYLTQERKKRRGRSSTSTTSVWASSPWAWGRWKIVYDRGQIDDWFGSRFITVLIVVAVVCIMAVIVWELLHPHPIINLRLLKERNFAVGCLIMFCTFAVLYGSTILLPQMLQALYGYDAFHGGVGAVAGRHRHHDRHAGRRLSTGQTRRRAHSDFRRPAGRRRRHLLELAPQSVRLGRNGRHPPLRQVVGMAFIFAPINTAAYIYIPEKEHNNATALFNMVRNEGASLGIALVTILVDRRSQFHQARISDHFNQLNPNFQPPGSQNDATASRAAGYDPTTAHDMALGELYRQVQRQAQALSYFDVFWLFAMAGFLVVPLVFFMRRSVSEKGAAAGMH